MTVRVAINGFGRIGRNVLRAIAESGRNDIEVVGINDLGPVETNAHLLRYDSRARPLPRRGDGQRRHHRASATAPIKVTAERDPAKLPWKDLGVDIALECTGIFTVEGEGLGASRPPAPSACWSRRRPTAPTSPSSTASTTTS